MTNALVCLAAAVSLANVFAGEGPELIQTVKDGDGGVSFSDHVGPVTARGAYIYAAIHYEGRLAYFHRDLKTGLLTYAGVLAFDKPDMSIDSLVWANGRLYFYGGAGHETGDGDSRGLHWLDVDPTLGKPVEKGKMDISLASGLVASPDQKCLYLLLKQQHKVIRYQLEKDGTPKKTTETVFPATGEMSDLYITPDGKTLYARVADPGILYRMAIGPDGSMVCGGTNSLAKLTEGIIWPAGKWGYGWGRGFGVSPDGLCFYADFCNYGGADARTALFVRDPKTGEVMFKAHMETKTGGKMVKMLYAFEPDSTRGYFASQGETSGNVVGWFDRDPKIGELTFGDVVKGTGGGPFCIFLDSENGFLYSGTWATKQLFVIKTGKGKE
jgi:hypothetical protein